MKKMNEWGFIEKDDFEGLVPKANVKIGAVIGEELEVVDIEEIAK